MAACWATYFNLLLFPEMILRVEADYVLIGVVAEF